MNQIYTIITAGEYSDYGVLAIVRWLSEQTPEEVRREFLQELATLHGPNERFSGKYLDRALPWLIVKGFCEKLEMNELNLGSSNSLHDSWGFK